MPSVIHRNLLVALSLVTLPTTMIGGYSFLWQPDAHILTVEIFWFYTAAKLVQVGCGPVRYGHYPVWNWVTKFWGKSPFPLSWLPRWPSQMKSFLSWPGALRWHRLSRCHLRKLPRNQVVVRWKSKNLTKFRQNFGLFTWLQPGYLVASPIDSLCQHTVYQFTIRDPL